MNIRYVEIRYGDDLRKIALRELGDASKWLGLITLNGLKPPYVAAQASAGVLAYGDLIKVPAAVSSVSSDVDAADIYGVDVSVDKKKLVVVGGDFAIVSGLKNLTQAIARCIIVDKRELAFHPEYGCHVRSLLGAVNGPTAGQLAALYVKSSILEDDRILEVSSCVAEVLGDQISVSASVVPVTGKPVDLKLVV